MSDDPVDAALAAAEQLVGTTIGSYRLARVLGCGGMGAVYLGEHPVIGAQVAIKILHAECAADPAVVERFFNEARAVNVIGHPNIVKILDLAVEHGRYYFVMEYLQGQPLRLILTQGAPLPLEVAGPIVLQCCAALQAAHERRIVHRDLKPDNIFLTSHLGKKHVVKLLDFGIAKLSKSIDPGAERTAAGVVLGTPAYMSPEQAEGRPERVDGRSDLYSLGVLLFQMATGVLPFVEDSFARLMVAHLETAPPPPRSLAPGLPEGWERIVLRCLAKRREDRFQSMRELGLAVTECLARLGIPTALPDEDGAPPPGPAAGPVFERITGPPARAGAAQGPARPKLPLEALRTRQSRHAPSSTAGAPPPGPRLPPAVPVVGSGLPDEPLPGAEMFEPPPPDRPASRPSLSKRALDADPALRVLDPGEGPLELDLAASPPPAEPAPEPPPQEPTLQLPEGPAAEVAPAPGGRRALRAALGALLSISLVAAVIAAALALTREAREKEDHRGPSTFVPETDEVALAGPRARQKPLKNGVSLRLVTDPPGAQVTARWSTGSASGVTPCSLDVPRGAQVKLSYRRAGSGGVDSEITADGPRMILETLPEQ